MTALTASTCRCRNLQPRNRTPGPFEYSFDGTAEAFGVLLVTRAPPKSPICFIGPRIGN